MNIRGLSTILLILFYCGNAVATPQYEFYGIIKATTLYSSSPLNSFSYVNPSAPTGAAPDQGLSVEEKNSSLWTQQVAQSRMGVNIQEDQLLGNFEIDFINFALSSPTTETRPRLRRAFVRYWINENHSFQLGQDWDTFSPGRPETLDYVGLYFNTGNVGFMRQQVKWIFKSNDLESHLSLGLPGKNPGSETNGLEISSFPALAYSLRFCGFELSTFYASIKPENSSRTDVLGIDTSFNYKLGDSFNFLASLYWGKNLGDAGLLGISHLTSQGDLTELGGFINLKWSSRSVGQWVLGYGFSTLDNKEKADSYNYNVTSQKIIENGIIQNELLRLFNSLSLTDRVKLSTEISFFKTTRQQNLNTNMRHNALTVESGFLYSF